MNRYIGLANVTDNGYYVDFVDITYVFGIGYDDAGHTRQSDVNRVTDRVIRVTM